MKHIFLIFTLLALSSCSMGLKKVDTKNSRENLEEPTFWVSEAPSINGGYCYPLVVVSVDSCDNPKYCPGKAQSRTDPKNTIDVKIPSNKKPGDFYCHCIVKNQDAFLQIRDSFLNSCR